MQASELTLWNSYHNQGCKASREKLILDYENVVKGAVRRISKGIPAHVDLDDLYSTGMIGLIGALENYRLDRKCSFGTFAKIRVQGAILDAMRQSDWAPRAMRSRSRQIDKARQLLANDLGHEPSEAEICEAVGITSEEYANHQHSYHRAMPMPLDAVLLASDKDGVTRGEKMPDPKAKDGLTIQLEACDSDALKSAILRLSERERQIICMMYFDELKGNEISEILGISESRVSQLHANALDRLERFGSLRRELSIA